MKYLLLTLIILYIIFNNNKIEGFNKKACLDNTIQSGNKCYKKSYDIIKYGYGTPCPFYQKNYNDFCYEACKEGYIIQNGKCVAICPKEYIDYPDYCQII